MKDTRKPLMLLLGVVLAASCSPSLTEAEMTATQEALYSPTPTNTSTPTPTSTTTPTVTLTPTATPIPVDMEIQDNDSTLVRVPAYGFQFDVPSGWTYSPPDSGSEAGYMGSARIEFDGGSSAYFNVTIMDTNQSLEDYLESRINQYRYGFGFTIHRQGVSSNPYSVTVAYFEASGEFDSTPIHVHAFFFRSKGELIFFYFGRNIHSIRSAIGQIQASIQLID